MATWVKSGAKKLVKRRRRMPTDTDPEPSVAVRRARREVKANSNSNTTEEDAQLLLAIKLSLKEQKKTKKVIGKNNAKPLDPPSKKICRTGKQSRQHHQRQTELRSKLSSKLIHCKKSTESFHQVEDRKSKTKLKRTLPAQKADVPSTLSFISYILQTGAANRDMELAKRFEMENPSSNSSESVQTEHNSSS